jgi:hypothetical protein
MKPVDLIAAALADGITLRLDSGKLKAMGDGGAVHRWLAVIREHKVDIIDVLKVGAGDTAVEPIDREAFEERAGIAEFDGGLSREDAEALAWQEDDRRRCGQCLNLRGDVCSIAKPGGLVSANRGYRPVKLPMRCAGYSPKAGDTDQRAGAVRWPGLAS